MMILFFFRSPFAVTRGIFSREEKRTSTVFAPPLLIERANRLHASPSRRGSSSTNVAGAENGTPLISINMTEGEQLKVFREAYEKPYGRMMLMWVLFITLQGVAKRSHNGMYFIYFVFTNKYTVHSVLTSFCYTLSSIYVLYRVGLKKADSVNFWLLH